MNHSESMTKLAAALAKAQGEMENAAKSSDNPFFRSKYADLAEIINTARPVLAKHGLSIVQIPGFDGSTVTLENILLHESGEWMSGLAGAPMPVMTTKDGRELPPSPQGIGSAVTYLRRYSMAALCMIAQEDDDGNAATEGHAPRQATAPTPRPAQSKPVGVQHSNAPDILDQTLTFGKMKGRTWGWLVEHDPSYVEWAIAKMERLAPDARDHLKLALADRAMQPVGQKALDDPDFSDEHGGSPLPF